MEVIPLICAVQMTASVPANQNIKKTNNKQHKTTYCDTIGDG